uniref:Uncharacterized protein n=1 Tax=Caenorhabditis japonica TaxID=281687 RepID=A0A8R1E5L6_CAEJA
QQHGAAAHPFWPSLTLAPKFEGRQSFQSYIRNLNDFLNAQFLSEEVGRRLLPFLLIGTARDAYDSLSDEIRNEPKPKTLEAAYQAARTEGIASRLSIRRRGRSNQQLDRFYCQTQSPLRFC